MKKSVVFFVLVLLFSCNQEEKEREKQQEIRTYKVEEIKLKYGVKYSLNELYFRFSYQFNPVIEDGKLLIDKYSINDIYTKDGETFVSIDVFYSYYLDLLIEDENILQELLNIKKSSEDENGVLVITLEKTRKIPFIVEAYEESYGDEIEFTTEVARNNYDFIGTGKILNIIKL